MVAFAAILPVLSSVLDRVIPDTNARKAAKEALEVMDQQGELSIIVGQLEINKVEAAHKSLFVAGWRPFIGWVCGLALLYNFILNPFLDIWFDMPIVEVEKLYPVLMGMLGLGGMRSFEKLKGVSREA